MSSNDDWLAKSSIGAAELVGTRVTSVPATTGRELIKLKCGEEKMRKRKRKRGRRQGDNNTSGQQATKRLLFDEDFDIAKMQDAMAFNMAKKVFKSSSRESSQSSERFGIKTTTRWRRTKPNTSIGGPSLVQMCLVIFSVALTALLLGPWASGALESGTGRHNKPPPSATDNQTAGPMQVGSSPKTGNPTVQLGQSSAQQFSSNLSSLMMGQASQMMSNTSLMTQIIGHQQQQPHQPNGSAESVMGSNQTTMTLEPMQARMSQSTLTNSSLAVVSAAQMSSKSGEGGGSSAGATKDGQMGNRGPTHHQQTIANSPAFNSRQKTSSPGSSQRAPTRQQRLEGGSSQLDNQMAADDMHETQAFMAPASSGGRQRASQEDESKLRGAPSGESGNMSGVVTDRQTAQGLAGGIGEQSRQPQAMAMSSGDKSMTNGASKQPAISKSSPPMGSHQSNHDGWQVVSTSIQNSSPSSVLSSSPATGAATWPPRQRAQGGGASSSSRPQKYLPPPPPPINYNNFYRQQQQQQHLMDQMSASAFQQQQQQLLLQQQHLTTAAVGQLEGTQLERPSAGYSYGSPAYTHTAQLAPARQELEAANEQQLRSTISTVKQRQRQYLTPVDQISRSSSSMNAHLEQQQITSLGGSSGSGLSSPKTPPNQLPQFQSSSVHYSTQQQHPSVQHKQHVQLSMMPPPPQPPVTGTHSSPCKPPPLLQLGLQQQQLQEQLLLATNDLTGAASSQLSSSSSSASLGLPRYVRLGAGTRLRSMFIFKVLRADSLTDCELACAKASLVAGGNPQDTCRSFNYRAYFAAENCELSRSDARQLKLEDNSQFEQNTQFDFYALASGVTESGLSLSSQQLAQLQQAPIVQQQVSSLAPYTPAAQESDCLDVSQSCSQEGMEFTLRTIEPFMGRIYTYGFYESCYLDGDGQTSNTLRISRSNGFPRCGTQQIGDLMTNIVVVQFNDHVQTTRDKKYNLTCYFSGPGEAVVTSSYFDTKLDERSHPMQIEHLPPQNVITSNVQLRILHHGTPTNTIAVGDLLTFRLETQSTGSGGTGSSASSGIKQGRANQQQTEPRQHEIFATNVIAKDPYSGRQVQLIDARGCPVDPVNVFPELQRTTDGALESEFYAFKMPDSNFLIFQATVRACKSPCEPVICHRTTGSGSLASSPGLGGNALQQYQMAAASSAGIKGSASQQQLGAYLMAATQQNAVPSWGRRRRRRKRQSNGPNRSGTSEQDTENGAIEQEEGDEELLGTGESVEHVIPVRLVNGNGRQHASPQPDQPTSSRPAGVITRFKRPELSEAEEEVKEMFRVYLTRAEINNKRRQAQEQQLKELGVMGPLSGSLVSSPATSANGNSSYAHSWDSSSLDGQPTLADPELSSSSSSSQVCLTQAGYYVMLFSIISLSLVVLSVLTIALYITKKAKFHISETLADAMF